MTNCMNIMVLVGLPKSDESFPYCTKFRALWSLILYSMASGPSCTTHVNRNLSYRINLLQQLIGTFMLCKCIGKKRSLPIYTAFPKLFHLEKLQTM